VSSKNAGATKLCALLHQIEDRVFSLAADDGQAAQVDYQFASFQVVARISPGGAKLVDPWATELSFHHQLALRSAIDSGNLEHIGSRAESCKRKPDAKVTRSQSAEIIDGIKIVGELCQRMSKSNLTLVELREATRDKTRRRKDAGFREANDLFCFMWHWSV
jgi:hypothetical protein